MNCFVRKRVKPLSLSFVFSITFQLFAKQQAYQSTAEVVLTAVV